MRIYLDTIGCRLNQSEIERMARQFRQAGHSLAASAEEADLAVINTCAVTQAAVSDSRQKVRQAARQGVEKIVVTGCWASLQPTQAGQLPNVQVVIDNQHKDALVAHVLDVPPETFDLEPLERQPIPGARLRTRAFIKVQDGCDNRCTFCVTTIARGGGRSLSVAEILGEIQLALDGGAQEIVLTGVHLGSWGHDFEHPQHLRQLIETILARTATPRLRLSSLEPWDLDAGFFSLWQDPRLCRHLHLPLQSGSDSVLRRMARRTNQAAFRDLVEAARQASPHMAITTDLIAGFPGESEAEFADSLAYVRSLELAGGHVFTYSARPGTAAARMPGQVPMAERKARNAAYRQALAESGERYRLGFVGQTVEVLWESATALGPQGWTLSGLSDTYLRVQAQAPQSLWNQLGKVQLNGLLEDGLSGTLLPQPVESGSGV